jgi:hypothetical protein
MFSKSYRLHRMSPPIVPSPPCKPPDFRDVRPAELARSVRALVAIAQGQLLEARVRA